MWDFHEHPEMCSVYMETTDGAKCWAVVECNDGRKEYNNDHASWNVCYQGGRQYFHDDRIGDFSITFTEKDREGEGLTTPILQVKNIGDWKEIPVAPLAHQKWTADDCKAHMGTECDNGPFMCHFTEYDYSKGRTRKYECGVPKIGLGGGEWNSQAPTNERGYAPGWCGVHVKHYQKPDPSKDQYALEVSINDANEGKLPWTLIVNTGAVDADPVQFAYGGQTWDSNDKNRCSVGAYDNNERQMDCGFTCD
ncbi:hypothetical protein K458DRAFT_342944 [Lentithecium fluviatile CBS 122367]|uniref:Uncharacterized protein n=1 Tax=Lentithecium fluviatile CBS 122367 TaxID=1168545 RepID=A0A6G1IUK4_9PLEO|nr:hypothetical protein K458DRAFT_342944 [Lentithecium fluviatile CBS 122367]